MDVVEEARAVVLAGGTMSPVRTILQHSATYLQTVRLDMRCYQPVIFTPSIGEDNIFFMRAYYTRRQSPNFSCA